MAVVTCIVLRNQQVRIGSHIDITIRVKNTRMHQLYAKNTMFFDNFTLCFFSANTLYEVVVSTFKMAPFTPTLGRHQRGATLNAQHRRRWLRTASEFEIPPSACHSRSSAGGWRGCRPHARLLPSAAAQWRSCPRWHSRSSCSEDARKAAFCAPQPAREWLPPPQKIESRNRCLQKFC